MVTYRERKSWAVCVLIVYKKIRLRVMRCHVLSLVAQQSLADAVWIVHAIGGARVGRGRRSSTELRKMMCAHGEVFGANTAEAHVGRKSIMARRDSVLYCTVYLS